MAGRTARGSEFIHTYSEDSGWFQDGTSGQALVISAEQNRARRIIGSIARAYLADDAYVRDAGIESRLAHQLFIGTHLLYLLDHVHPYPWIEKAINSDDEGSIAAGPQLNTCRPLAQG